MEAELLEKLNDGVMLTKCYSTVMFLRQKT